MTNRANFTTVTRRQLEINAGGFCANPGCRHLTRGPTQSRIGSASIGNAAHIDPASVNGPIRPGATDDLTSDQLRAIENGVWLCATCATLVDTNPDAYPVTMLKKWQSDAERWAYFSMNNGLALPVVAATKDVIACAIAFRTRIQALRLPSHPLRFSVNIDTLTIDGIIVMVQDARAQRDLSGLRIPPGPLQGLEPELVALQEQILTLLWTFAHLVMDSDELRRDQSSRRFEERRLRYSPVFVASGDQFLAAVYAALKKLDEWCTGRPYYGPLGP